MARSDGYDGMANLAHSIRRSTAMYVAMQVTEPGSTLEQMFDNFDRIAARIGGHAEEQTREPPEPLGENWRDTVGG